MYYSLLICRIFVHAKNNFNHIKEGFLDYQRRNNSSVSPNQAIMCTCVFTGFNQPFCPQLNICPCVQERATKSFILWGFIPIFPFHNCYHHYCYILNFNTHSPPHFENNSMKVSKRSTFIIIFLVDQWTQLCFLRQEIICHNVSGLAIYSLQWMVALIVWREF